MITITEQLNNITTILLSHESRISDLEDKSITLQDNQSKLATVGTVKKLMGEMVIAIGGECGKYVDSKVSEIYEALAELEQDFKQDK